MLFEAHKRVDQLKANTSWKNAGVYDPEGVRGTHVIYVLGDASNPEKYGGGPPNPSGPPFVRMSEFPLQWLGGDRRSRGAPVLLLQSLPFVAEGRCGEEA